MKKLVIGVVAVIVILIAAVLVAPSFVDWNARKQQIAELVKDATGRDLTINGDIDVTILPRPAFRVEDVRLSNAAGGSAPEMVRLPEARVSVAFGPLFEGQLAIVVTLLRPTVNLEKSADGRTNWQFDTAAPTAGDAVPGEQSGGQTDGPNVKLDSFRIVDGTISYLDAEKGAFERIERLNSDISFDSLQGPFRLEGETTVRGLPVSIEASTGRLKPDEPLSFLVEMKTPGGNTEMQVRGNLSDSTGDPSVKAEVTATVEDAAALLRASLGGTPPPVMAQPLSIQAGLDASAEAVALNAIEVEFGEARLTGDIKAELGATQKVSAVLRAGNLNLDAFLDGGSDATAKTPDSAAGGSDTSPTTDGEPGPPQMKTTEAGGFELPMDLDATVDVLADVVQYHGSVIRGVTVKTALKGGRIAVEDVSAVFPGNSTVAVNGSVVAANGEPQIDLRVNGRSDNLREVLEWLDVDIAAVPADRLRRFTLSTDVAGTPRNLTARNIAMKLDSSQISGGLALVLRDKPAFGLRLAVDKLNLDGYLPPNDRPINVSPGLPAGQKAGSEETPADETPAYVEAIELLNRFDANIDATVGTVIVSRTPVSGLAVDLTVVNGGLDIRRLKVDDFAGVRADAKGKLGIATGQPSFEAEYRIDVTDKPRFVRFLGNPPELRNRQFGRIAASGKGSGSLESLSLDTKLEAMGGTLVLDGSIAQPLLAPQFNLAATLRAPELVRVLQLAVDDYSPAAGKLGPVDLSVQAEGSLGYIKLSNIAGHAGPVSLRGNADANFEGDRPKLRASLSTSEVLLDLFLPLESQRRSALPARHRIIKTAAKSITVPNPGERWSKDRLDLAALRSIDAELSLSMSALTKDPYRLSNPKADVLLEKGKLTLRSFESGFSTGTVTATGEADAQTDTLTAALNVAAKDVDVADVVNALRDYQVRLGPIRFGTRVKGPVAVTANMATTGGSAHDLVNALNGKGRITGQLQTAFSSETRGTSAVAGLAGALLGEKVKELRGVTNVVQGTDLLLSAFDGASTLNGDIVIANGVASTENLVLVGRGGRALTAGTVHLPRWTLDSVTDVTLGQDDDPYLVAEMTGALDDPYVKKVSGRILRTRQAPAQQAPSSGQPADQARDPLKSLLPRILNPQPAPAPSGEPAPSGQKKPKPEDVLKDLLQGFSR